MPSKTPTFKSGLNVIHSATIEPSRGGAGLYTAYLWGEYGRSSVLAGQTMRAWFGKADSVQHLREQLDGRYPGIHISEVESPTSRPRISVGHLPGPDDNVPGGALPDDIGEWPPAP